MLQAVASGPPIRRQLAWSHCGLCPEPQKRRKSLQAVIVEFMEAFICIVSREAGCEHNWWLETFRPV